MNRKVIMVQWVAGQVQGDIDLLGEVFRLGKLRVVTGMVICDLWECS